MSLILDSLQYTIRKIESYTDKLDTLNLEQTDLIKQVAQLNALLVQSKDCKTYYGKAVDILYERSIGRLKNTLNAALNYIIYDQDFAVDLVLEDKRGTKSLDIVFKDLNNGLEVDIKEGTGQGIITVVSFVLKMSYLLNQGSKILIADEKYSNVSEEYTERFFTFVKEMTCKHDMILILISHDKRFIDYADNVYLVSDGKFTKEVAVDNTECVLNSVESDKHTSGKKKTRKRA